jgi:hypothetical protein
LILKKWSLMLRLIQVGNSLPFSYPVDPNSEFEPGMIAQLSLMGNNIVCGVSDGTAPIGIIDDLKTSAFYAPSIDEEVIVPAVGQSIGGKLVTVTDITTTLKNPNILPNSFVCSIPVYLRERNGVIIIPSGTELNYDLDGDGIPDSIRAVCSYSYQIPGIPGDDSTGGSGRLTVWFMRGIYSTDKFEVGQHYPINGNLFVNESGLLTTRQPAQAYPNVGIILAPPTSRNQFLEFLWL